MAMVLALTGSVARAAGADSRSAPDPADRPGAPALRADAPVLPRPRPNLRAEALVFVDPRPAPLAIVARDTIGGSVLGSAVAGTFILYNMGIQGNSNYEWGRTLAWGAGVGGVVGLVWGLIDAGKRPAPSYRLALYAHDGNSMTLDVRKKDQSHPELIPFASGRF